MRVRSRGDSAIRNFVSSYRSPNIVRVIKSRRLKWTGHITRKEERRNAFEVLTG